MIDKNRFQALKEYIAECVNNNIFPGAAFGIVTKEESLFAAEGCSQLSPVKERTNTEVIYDLASLTKVVSTTTIILKLVEQGKITLHTDIRELLGDFKHKDITVCNLLNHTSGLPSDIKDYRKSCKVREDIVKKVFSAELEYETGKKVVYSDIGYILLGLIIEKLASPIDRFFYENIAIPLDMQDTCYNPKEAMKSRCATTEYSDKRGYIKGTVHDGKAYVLGGVSGHAGLFSTVKDLGEFCRMLLNDGVYGDKRLLSKASIKAMRECYTAGLNEKRGLGWLLKGSPSFMCDLASEDSVFHTGFTGTSILMDFENQFAFILLTNRIHPSRENDGIIKLRRNINNMAAAVVF